MKLKNEKRKKMTDRMYEKNKKNARTVVCGHHKIVVNI